MTKIEELLASLVAHAEMSDRKAHDWPWRADEYLGAAKAFRTAHDLATSLIVSREADRQEPRPLIEVLADLDDET